MNRSASILILSISSVFALQLGGKSYPDNISIFSSQTDNSCFRMECIIDGDSLHCTSYQLGIRHNTENQIPADAMKTELQKELSINKDTLKALLPSLEVSDKVQLAFSKYDSILITNGIDKAFVKKLKLEREASWAAGKRLAGFIKSNNIDSIYASFAQLSGNNLRDTTYSIWSWHDTYTFKRVRQNAYEAYIDGPSSTRISLTCIPIIHNSDTLYQWIYKSKRFKGTDKGLDALSNGTENIWTTISSKGFPYPSTEANLILGKDTIVVKPADLH